MKEALRVRSGAVLVSTLVAAAALAVALQHLVMANQTPAAPAPDGFDLVAAENGGRVEWATGQFWPAMYLLADTRHPGWMGRQNEIEEIVFSFFDHQSGLVERFLINPFIDANNDRPKEVEVWTSSASATDGFVKAGAGTLAIDNRLQSIALEPAEAKYVKLRILSTYGPRPDVKPGGFAIAAKRVKILEGQRAGYVSMLARNPALAGLAKGVVPAAPATAALPVPPADGPATCSVPVPNVPKQSRFPQSRQVLVITDDPRAYRAIAWKPSLKDRVEDFRTVVPGVNFSWASPAVVSPAHLIADGTDTVVFAQVCSIDGDLSKPFKQALLAWVAAGHKMIIQDSDYCAGPNTPKYPFMPYPFATLNPGAHGAKGEAGILENSTLASARKADTSFIDADGWKSGPNDLGDSNIIVQYDARWCGAMWARNNFRKNGLGLAYARYGRGLIIYDGFDYDQYNNPIYRKLAAQELKQAFDPDNLPCSQPLGSFIITTAPDQKSLPMAAGRTYTYPVSVLGNFGYTGRVTLDASVVPADPGVSVKLDATVADLSSSEEAKATLTVTASPSASLASKAIAVRGRDAAGKSNVLCLNLPERTTGSVSVTSILRKDKPPTKNLEIILDASGSMKALLGKQTRWVTALNVLKDVVAKLPKDFSVGLRAYGHTLPSTNPKTCSDSSLVVPVGPLNASVLLGAAQKLTPRGETPLVYSILQTPTDLKSTGGGTVVLITDGEESCKGDFAAAAKTLKDAGLRVTLNIVGFTLKSAPAVSQLSGLAESTGGHYFSASNGDALSRAVLLAAVDRLPYRIVDAAAKEVARGEAGVDRPHELAPGNYRVIVTAADQEVATAVTIAVGQDVVLKGSIRGDKLVVER